MLYTHCVYNEAVENCINPKRHLAIISVIYYLMMMRFKSTFSKEKRLHCSCVVYELHRWQLFYLGRRMANAKGRVIVYLGSLILTQYSLSAMLVPVPMV